MVDEFGLTNKVSIDPSKAKTINVVARNTVISIVDLP